MSRPHTLLRDKAAKRLREAPREVPSWKECRRRSLAAVPGGRAEERKGMTERENSEALRHLAAKAGLESPMGAVEDAYALGRRAGAAETIAITPAAEDRCATDAVLQQLRALGLDGDTMLVRLDVNGKVVVSEEPVGFAAGRRAGLAEAAALVRGAAAGIEEQGPQRQPHVPAEAWELTATTFSLAAEQIEALEPGNREIAAVLDEAGGREP